MSTHIACECVVGRLSVGKKGVKKAFTGLHGGESL